LKGITSLPNFIKIYQAVQKILTDPFYLKPAMPLGRFCPTVNHLVITVHSTIQTHLVAMVTYRKKNLVTVVHKQSKPTVKQGSPNNFETQ
jgi:hypothetical protein